MIIEWNVHMFSSDLQQYPFHPDAAYTPNPEVLSADPLADYIERMQTEEREKEDNPDDAAGNGI